MLTLMPRACPLFKQSANLVGIEIQNILEKIYGIVITIIGGSSCVIDVPTCEEKESIGSGAEGKVVKLENYV